MDNLSLLFQSFPKHSLSNLNQPQILWIPFNLNVTQAFRVTAHITFPKLVQRLIGPVNLRIIFICELGLWLLNRGVLLEITEDGEAALDWYNFWVQLFSVWSKERVSGWWHKQVYKTDSGRGL